MIIGGLIFLILGFVELMVVQIMIYPALRGRFEQAKVTGSHGIDPARIMNAIKFQSLVLMPLLGFYMGRSFQIAGG